MLFERKKRKKGCFFCVCEYGNSSEFEVVYSNVGSVLNFSKGMVQRLNICSKGVLYK